MMSNNFWDEDQKKLFRSILREYEAEGYTHSEANTLAKKEVDEIMEQKIGLVHQIWEDTYEEE
tara:strand:- start:963 stop:1151 length:189 start_codon:yes stop_codon:yes gene_type:complete